MVLRKNLKLISYGALKEFHKLKKDIDYIYSQSLQDNKKVKKLMERIQFEKMDETIERLGKEYDIYKTCSIIFN